MSTLSPLAEQIWSMKYRLTTPAGETVDNSVEDTWRRVAKALAAREESPEQWTDRFYRAMEGFRFIPAGRIIAGAGTGRAVTLFNCFVMGEVPDDMAGIFENLKQAALTLQQGGGIGYDFSTLRPRGALVRGVGADASGPLSFMDVWDAMCRTIMSAGSRRGAMMATLRCDHPDIEAFIAAKRDPARLRMFNLSVLVTDAFMDAVRQDSAWPLVFEGTVHREVRARALWDQIMRATYDYAEPGVIFIDRINARNNLHYCETINATNPCGEQPLPPYGACLLGSVNLAALVEEPFTGNATIPDKALRDLVPVAVRMLDNAIDTSRFPLEQQRHEAVAKRRMGLGVTGLADALIMCGVRYGSDEAVALTRGWLETLRDSAYEASIALAGEKRPFPLFDRDAYLRAPAVTALPDHLRERLSRDGIRNALLTSIAPTGTISLFADNVSSGIEPVFSLEYTRAVLMPDGTRREETVQSYAMRKFRTLFGDAALPETFVTAQDLEPRDHLVMQAAAQDFVDSSISKTINCPEDIPFEAFKDVYAQAYALGCKGCTTYRPNPITGSVLTASDDRTTDAPSGGANETRTAQETGAAPETGAAHADNDSEPLTDDAARFIHMTHALARPETLPGRTYKLTWPGSDHALYITLNDIVQDGRRRPFEIFINSKNMEHYAWTVALTRMISAVFRRGGDVSFVVEELKAVFDPRGGAWMQGRYVPSLLAAIGDVVERHMVAIGFMTQPEPVIPPGATVEGVSGSPDTPGSGPGSRPGSRKDGVAAKGSPIAQCPRCGGMSLLRQEGCDLCTSCGYSKCGS